MRSEESRKMKNAISGFLIVDKPSGMTSHDVIAVIRKGTGIRRIGHTGTLDPRASGVLVTLVGPSVRLSDYLVTSQKGYEAMIHFGATSDTYDAEGTLINTGKTPPSSEEEVLKAIEKFKGEIEQIPPAYSAIKINGQKACDMARKGKAFKLKPRNVTVYSFDLLDFSPPEITVDITCSSGTYIRSIAHDLGKELGCGAYLSALRRTISGKFSLRDAVTLPELQRCFVDGTWYQHLVPASEALSGMYPEVQLDMESESRIRHGQRIPAEPGSSETAMAISELGELTAMLSFCPETNEWRPAKVLYP